MRIAVTGAGGGLGRAVLARVGPPHKVIPLPHEDVPVEDLGSVTQAITSARPDVVLHAAAMTSVDGCELDPRGAFLVNALGSRNVAIASARSGALLVHVSTDYVFDGRKGEPYHEFDEPAPLSVYGRSKLAGEREVRAVGPEHVIVRTSWVFGGGKDFLSSALARLAAGDRVPALVDLIGTPTYVGHLAERLIPLVESGQRGVIHLGGPEPVTWHQLLARAVRAAGLPGEVAEQRSAELSRPAPRPVNSSLTSVVLPGTRVPPMPPLDQAVAEVLEAVRVRA